MKFAISIPFLVICLDFSIIGIVYTYRDSSRIYLGIETSWRARIIKSFITGATGSMIMLVAIIFLSIIDTNYYWTPNGFLIIAVMELFIFTGIFLGTLWGFSSIDKYRNFLLKRLKEKQKNEQSRK